MTSQMDRREFLGSAAVGGAATGLALATADGADPLRIASWSASWD